MQIEDGVALLSTCCLMRRPETSATNKLSL